MPEPITDAELERLERRYWDERRIAIGILPDRLEIRQDIARLIAEVRRLREENSGFAAQCSMQGDRVQELEGERDKIDEYYSHAQSEIRSLLDDNGRRVEQVRNLDRAYNVMVERNRELEAALEFYSDEESWKPIHTLKPRPGRPRPAITNAIAEDRGKRARAALARQLTTELPTEGREP